jgi:hypothetical protein
MGSTIMLKIIRGAGGAVGVGYVTGAGPDLKQTLQQQKRMCRLTMAPQIMAPGVVKAKWLVMLSLAMVFNSLSRTSALNFPEILSGASRWPY